MFFPTTKPYSYQASTNSFDWVKGLNDNAKLSIIGYFCKEGVFVCSLFLCSWKSWSDFLIKEIRWDKRWVKAEVEKSIHLY